MNSKQTWFRHVGALSVFLLAAGTSSASVRDVVCRIELDRDVLPADSTQRAIIKVALDAPPAEARERPPVNLCMVLDRSGSMRGDKLRKAQDALIEALRRLGSQDMVSVVIYDHEVETLVPAQSAANTAWIESRIREIQARGNTALFSGMSQGAAEVRKNLDRKYVSRILLLSDGQANVGPSAPDDLGRLGASLSKEGVSVTTIGLGRDYNEDLMTQLAQKSDGNNYYVEQSADLSRILAAELGDVLSVVAREVIIEIECPNGVRPIRIIGRDGRISGNRVDVRLSQLYGGQQKFALVEVEVSATSARETREIAVARCTYKNALTRDEGISRAQVTARFSSREADVEHSVNISVQKDIGYNAVAETKQKAIVLSDEGKTKEAAAELRKASGGLREKGEAMGIAPLLEESKKLDAEADRLETDGMSREKRKEYRNEGYVIQNQQLAK